MLLKRIVAVVIAVVFLRRSYCCFSVPNSCERSEPEPEEVVSWLITFSRQISVCFPDLVFLKLLNICFLGTGTSLFGLATSQVCQNAAILSRCDPVDRSISSAARKLSSLSESS